MYALNYAELKKVGITMIFGARQLNLIRRVVGGNKRCRWSRSLSVPSSSFSIFNSNETDFAWLSKFFPDSFENMQIRWLGFEKILNGVYTLWTENLMIQEESFKCYRIIIKFSHINYSLTKTYQNLFTLLGIFKNQEEKKIKKFELEWTHGSNKQR